MKKRKRKLKRSIKIIFSLFIIISLLLGYSYYNSPTTYLKGIGYKEKTIEVFKEKDIWRIQQCR